MARDPGQESEFDQRESDGGGVDGGGGGAASDSDISDLVADIFGLALNPTGWMIDNLIDAGLDIAAEIDWGNPREVNEALNASGGALSREVSNRIDSGAYVVDGIVVQVSRQYDPSTDSVRTTARPIAVANQRDANGYVWIGTNTRVTPGGRIERFVMEEGSQGASPRPQWQTLETGVNQEDYIITVDADETPQDGDPGTVIVTDPDLGDMEVTIPDRVDDTIEAPEYGDIAQQLIDNGISTLENTGHFTFNADGTIASIDGLSAGDAALAAAYNNSIINGDLTTAVNFISVLSFSQGGGSIDSTFIPGQNPGFDGEGHQLVDGEDQALDWIFMQAVLLGSSGFLDNLQHNMAGYVAYVASKLTEWFLTDQEPGTPEWEEEIDDAFKDAYQLIADFIDPDTAFHFETNPFERLVLDQIAIELGWPVRDAPSRQEDINALLHNIQGARIPYLNIGLPGFVGDGSFVLADPGFPISILEDLPEDFFLQFDIPAEIYDRGDGLQVVPVVSPEGDLELGFFPAAEGVGAWLYAMFVAGSASAEEGFTAEEILELIQGARPDEDSPTEERLANSFIERGFLNEAAQNTDGQEKIENLHGVFGSSQDIYRLFFELQEKNPDDSIFDNPSVGELRERLEGLRDAYEGERFVGQEQAEIDRLLAIQGLKQIAIRLLDEVAQGLAPPLLDDSYVGQQIALNILEQISKTTHMLALRNDLLEHGSYLPEPADDFFGPDGVGFFAPYVDRFRETRELFESLRFDDSRRPVSADEARRLAQSTRDAYLAAQAQSSPHNRVEQLQQEVDQLRRFARPTTRAARIEQMKREEQKLREIAKQNRKAERELSREEERERDATASRVEALRQESRAEKRRKETRKKKAKVDKLREVAEQNRRPNRRPTKQEKRQQAAQQERLDKLREEAREERKRKRKEKIRLKTKQLREIALQNARPSRELTKSERREVERMQRREQQLREESREERRREERRRKRKKVDRLREIAEQNRPNRKPSKKEQREIQRQQRREERLREEAREQRRREERRRKRKKVERLREIAEQNRRPDRRPSKEERRRIERMQRREERLREQAREERRRKERRRKKEKVDRLREIAEQNRRQDRRPSKEERRETKRQQRREQRLREIARQQRREQRQRADDREERREQQLREQFREQRRDERREKKRKRDRLREIAEQNRRPNRRPSKEERRQIEREQDRRDRLREEAREERRRRERREKKDRVDRLREIARQERRERRESREDRREKERQQDRLRELREQSRPDRGDDRRRNKKERKKDRRDRLREEARRAREERRERRESREERREKERQQDRLRAFRAQSRPSRDRRGDRRGNKRRDRDEEKLTRQQRRRLEREQAKRDRRGNRKGNKRRDRDDERRLSKKARLRLERLARRRDRKGNKRRDRNDGRKLSKKERRRLERQSRRENRRGNKRRDRDDKKRRGKKGGRNTNVNKSKLRKLYRQQQKYLKSGDHAKRKAVNKKILKLKGLA